MCACNNLTVEKQNRVSTIHFDIVNGECPLIVCLDLNRHSDTINRTYTSTIATKRPTDTCFRTFHTYMAKDDIGNDRERVEVVPHETTAVFSKMGIGLMEISEEAAQVYACTKDRSETDTTRRR